LVSSDQQQAELPGIKDAMPEYASVTASVKAGETPG
jgi:hypothetical protein